ncbi:MAG: TonB-dependent receptor [Dysgonamonadaceae bacterium]|jgi:TonB-linked SusC/RagA family outer membrane protein|nr:TonB-dependent receptor [Dysgonamonadaceae bacterium]
MRVKLKILIGKLLHSGGIRTFIFLLCAVFLLGSTSVFAQEGSNLKGRVVDMNGDGIPGVLINVVGSTRGVAADDDGNFEMTNVVSGTKLVASSLGMANKEITYTGQSSLIIVMEEQVNELDEFTVVGFAKQKKERVIGSIQSVDTKDLRVPSSNLTTSFAGRIAGMISYQTSGEPGAESNADFFIRGVTSFGTGKVDPLILIDNIEVSKDDLAKLHPDDLQSFSVLKDATATAIYGARGANGVILISTKEGKEGKSRVNFRVENGWSSPTSKLEMAGAADYMNMANEAYSTRAISQTGSRTRRLVYPRAYIQEVLRGIEDPSSVDTYLYPYTDWMDMLIKDVATNQRVNMSVSGGGKVARYYVSGSFANDNGILKKETRSDFDNNVNYKKYTLHSNINIDITPTTSMAVRLHGGFDDYQGPMAGGNDLYSKILQVSPVRFPAYYPSDYGTGTFIGQNELGEEEIIHVKGSYANASHILFGNDFMAASNPYMNPYAEMLRGYRTSSTSSLMAQFELKQDLSGIMKGLSGRALVNATRNAQYALVRSKEPFYYTAFSSIYTNDVFLEEINPDKGRDYLTYKPESKGVQGIMYGEASLNYANNFDIHNVSGMLVATGRNRQTGDAEEGKFFESLPERNLGLAGRFTYDYDLRYIVELNFGYNGSEKFAAKHRWGFFPSLGAGYLISNEKFWTPIKDKISMLKLRYSYGLVGNDAIGDQRFFYLENVSLNSDDARLPEGDFSYGYTFNGWGKDKKGVKINAYKNESITWEIAYKHNLGIELGFFNKVNILADIYKEHRVNILQPRSDISVTMGLWSVPYVNSGEADTEGIDISLDYNQSFSKDWWLTARGNFTFAHSTFAVYEEAGYAELGSPWRSHVGMTTKQRMGYIAERLFIDNAEIEYYNGIDGDPSSAYQSGAMPGDIMYKDLNGDGTINDLDKTGIGYPTTPEINYGFGFSIGYKGIDLSAFFQGSDRASLFINSQKMAPFIIHGPTNEDNKLYETGLAQFIADDYWSEANPNPYARWPRLASSESQFSNNWMNDKDEEGTPSTFWMYDNSYLRFKSLELGYSLPDKWTKKMRVGSLRLYVSGTNLLLFSKFKFWDVELASNGLNYPLQRVWNVGLNLTL